MLAPARRAVSCIIGAVAGPCRSVRGNLAQSAGARCCLPLFFLALGLAMFSGCGGEDPQPTNPNPAQQTPVQTADATLPEENPADATNPDGADGDPNNPDGAPADGGEAGDADSPMKEAEKKPAEEPKPERPAEVSKWKVADYLSARRENDRNLQQAVAYMGDKFAGDARAVNLFRQLLEKEALPIKKNPDGSEGRAEFVEATPPVINEVITALGKNKTPESAALLRELLLGKFDLVLPRRSVITAVCNALVENQAYQEYEDFLFELVVQTKQVLADAAPDQDETLTPPRLRQEVLGLLSQKSTPALNVRLAKHLDDPQVPAELAADIEPVIILERPEKFPAKLILFRNIKAEPRTKSVIESSIVSHCEAALNVLLEMPDKPEDPPAPGTVSRPTNRKLGRSPEVEKTELELAAQAWTPDMLEFVNGLIKKADSPESTPGLVQIVGSFPTQNGRFSMSELMAYHAYRGTRIWSGAGLFGRSVSDPGFVILAKDIYHGAARRVTRVDPNDLRPPVEQSVRDQWRDAMEPLVQGWIRRAYSAAQFADQAAMSAARSQGNFKVVLHRDAKVATEYHLTWPGTAQAEIPGVPLAPVEIHYVRIEEEGVPEKIYNHYKRFGGGANAPKHTVRNGYWLDDLGNGATPKSKRSVDIMINHKPLPEEKPVAGVVQDPKPVALTIDILTIEIPDPTVPATTSAE